MDLAAHLEVGTLAERKFAFRRSLTVPTHRGGWLISFQDNPEVHILDASLNELDRVDLQAQTQEYSAPSVAMDRSGELFAVSAQTEVRICDRRGMILHEFPHSPWSSWAGSSCFFDLENRLWYVRPGDDPYGEDNCLCVIDPASGITVFERNFVNDDGHVTLFPSPCYEDVLIEVACGQDGCFLHRARLIDTGLITEPYPWDDRTFCGGFSPDGKEFATGAHACDCLNIHNLQSGQVVATIDNRTIFESEEPIFHGEHDAVGYRAIFLDDNHILVESQFGRMMLFHRADLRLIGTIWQKGGRLYGFDRDGKETKDPNEIMGFGGGPTSFHPAGAGRLLVDYEKSLQLLDVSTVLSLR